MRDELHVRGVPVEQAASRDVGIQHSQDIVYSMQQHVVAPAGGARSSGKQIETVVLDGDDRDVLEIESTDGLTTFMTVGQAKRSSPDRGVTRLEQVLGGSRSGDSGLAGVTLSRFSIQDPTVAGALSELQVELAENVVKAGVRAALTPAARWAMQRIVTWVDRPVPDTAPPEKYRDGPKTRGVYTLDGSLRLEPQRLETELAARDKPWLVLLHGTFSHTEAAFGRLRGTPEWEELAKRYPERMVALEHATLSKSPVANAIDLVNVLPEDATLHLVSHSRGGLIGEALALAQLISSVDKRIVPPQERGRFAELPDAYEELDDLRKIVHDKGIRIERFARVACPANGTLLASRRVEKYAELMFNVLKLVPALNGAGVLEVVKFLLLTFLDQRSDPRAIPGLEAQMPESPFIRYLNTRPDVIDDGLGVVAGDVQGSGIVKRFKVLLADGFFREDHDMVVNTGAMVGGLNRSEPAVAFFKGAPYSHSAYFGDPASRKASRQLAGGHR